MNKLHTPEWSEFDSNHPLTEYPYPQFKRESYFSLNGVWNFKFSDTKEIPQEFHQTIVVPYCVESEASQIHQAAKSKYFIYQKKFHLDASFIKDISFLHLLGVDQKCIVILNGTTFEEQVSLCLPIKIDISSSLKEDNVLTIIVEDNQEDLYPHGKQSSHPKGIFYTPVSGIYYPIFIESVPKDYIRKIYLKPSMEKLDLMIESLSTSFQVQIFEGEKCIINEVISSHHVFFFPNPHLWSLEDPFLYKMILSTEHDKIESYFALRSIKKKNGFLYLNEEKIFIKAVLDQGYYPEGIWTPISYKSYERDILSMKNLGFNCLRKHIKVELPYFYYLCDKLGMLVFQDFVNNGPYHFFRDTALPTIGISSFNDQKLHKDPKQRELFKLHAKKLQAYLYNSPCVIAYTIFNEGWGQFSADDNYILARDNDPTRFYDATSGWFHQNASDFNSYHLYFSNIKKCKKIPSPFFLSEFGGFAYKIEGHILYDKKSFGYKFYSSKEELMDGFNKLFLMQLLPYKEKMCGFVYTQLSDVETELNGLFTYDRQILKVDPTQFKELLDQFHF